MGEAASIEVDAADAVALVGLLNGLGGRIVYSVGRSEDIPQHDERIVLSHAAMGDVAHPAHAKFLRLMDERGFGSRKRLISASMALRLGWASGFEIGAYLLAGRVSDIRDMSLVLDKGLVREVVIHSARLYPPDLYDGDAKRLEMGQRLHDKAVPFVEAHHGWSRLSRQALFSMLESSWAGQFVSIGEAAGFPEEAADEARAVLSNHPVLAAEAPTLYAVEAGGRRKTCQRRSLCCLYYKMPTRSFCGSCPIIPEDDRQERQRKFVSEYGLPVA